MKRSALALILGLTLTLAACSSTHPTAPPKAPEPAPTETQAPELAEADAATEAAYVEKLAAALPQRMDTPENREAILSFGYSLCKNAAEAGTTTGAAAQEHIDTLDPQDSQYMIDMGLALLAGQNAGLMLCPDYAE